MNTNDTQHRTNLEGAKHRSGAPAEQDVEALLSDYVALCNLAMAENQDKFWFRQAKRLTTAVLGGAKARTLVYDEEPGDVVGEFVVCLDPDRKVFKVQSPEEEKDTTYTWRVSTDFLKDVVHERPEWYLNNPTMLDWMWAKDRLSDAAERIDGRSFTTGFVLGAALVVVLAMFSVPKVRAGKRGRYQIGRYEVLSPRVTRR